MKTVKVIIIAAAVVNVSGCSIAPHGLYNYTDRVDVSRNTKYNYPSYNGNIKISMTPLRELDGVKYEYLGRVDVTKVYYGGYRGVISDMRKAAAHVGGNAVVGVNLYKKPCGWAWASPQGYGDIIKVIDGFEKIGSDY